MPHIMLEISYKFNVREHHHKVVIMSEKLNLSVIHSKNAELF